MSVIKTFYDIMPDGREVYQYMIENTNGVKVGQARAIPHIKPAEEIAAEYFEQTIIEEIERRLSK